VNLGSRVAAVVARRGSGRRREARSGDLDPRGGGGMYRRLRLPGDRRSRRAHRRGRRLGQRDRSVLRLLRDAARRRRRDPRGGRRSHLPPLHAVRPARAHGRRVRSRHRGRRSTAVLHGRDPHHEPSFWRASHRCHGLGREPDVARALPRGERYRAPRSAVRHRPGGSLALVRPRQRSRGGRAHHPARHQVRPGQQRAVVQRVRHLPRGGSRGSTPHHARGRRRERHAHSRWTPRVHRARRRDPRLPGRRHSDVARSGPGH
jgi:hypothetical protein